MSKKLSMVTGANGHLGYNLTRFLIDRGVNVRATCRNPKSMNMLSRLGCESGVVDLMDKDSLMRGMDGVEHVYAVGAAFKMWSKNPEKEIYQNNVQGTQNLFEAAKECGVKNIVYVSSVAALDFTQLPARESNGYNTDRRNWYYNSKNDSDKLALELGKSFGIRTVLVLPSAMIGGEINHLSYSNRLVDQVLKGKVVADTNITLNWIDVNDVVEGMYQAMLRGRDQERYILANEEHMTLQESVRIASKEFPDLKLKVPPKIPKPLLYLIGGLMEFSSKITEQEPLLRREYIKMFYGLKQDFDTSKARFELGFYPKSSKQALLDTLHYLKS